MHRSNEPENSPSNNSSAMIFKSPDDVCSPFNPSIANSSADDAVKGVLPVAVEQ